MRKFKQSGFSLIELLVVIVIIGILAAVGTVTYDNYIASSKTQLAKSQYDQIVKHVKNDLLLSFDSNSISSEELVKHPGSNSQANVQNYLTEMATYFNDTAGFKNPYSTGEFAVKPLPTLVKSTDLKNGEVEFVYTVASGTARNATLTIYLENSANDASTTISMNW